MLSDNLGKTQPAPYPCFKIVPYSLTEGSGDKVDMEHFIWYFLGQIYIGGEPERMQRHPCIDLGHVSGGGSSRIKYSYMGKS